MENGGITISGFDALHLPGHGLQGLLPGNPGKLTLAPDSRPFQGIKKPVRGIDPLTVGMAPGAHPGPAFPLLGLYPDDALSPDVDLHFTGTAAVTAADGPDDLFFLAFLVHWNYPPAWLFIIRALRWHKSRPGSILFSRRFSS
jgi:hypothetical protein